MSEVNDHPVFPVIIDRNAHRFGHLFERAEKLFEKLEAKKDQYVELTALGSYDTEQLIEKHCHLAEDWER